MGGSKDERRMRKMVKIREKGCLVYFWKANTEPVIRGRGEGGALGEGGRGGARDVNIAFITEIWRQIGE